MIPETKRGSKQIDDSKNLNERAEEFNHFFANAGRLAFEKTQASLTSDDADVNGFANGSLNFNENSTNFFRPKLVDCNTIILTIKGLKESNSDGIPFFSIVFYIMIIINTSLI